MDTTSGLEGHHASPKTFAWAMSADGYPMTMHKDHRPPDLG
jgi:hypothetical protein